MDGQLCRVKIRGRFLPARDLASEPGVNQLSFFRWLLRSMPVWLFRRLTRRDDWTVTVFAVRKGPQLRSERRLHNEHVVGFARAVERADELVEALEDHSFG